MNLVIMFQEDEILKSLSIAENRIRQLEADLAERENLLNDIQSFATNEVFENGSALHLFW